MLSCSEERRDKVNHMDTFKIIFILIICYTFTHTHSSIYYRHARSHCKWSWLRDFEAMHLGEKYTAVGNGTDLGILKLQNEKSEVTPSNHLTWNETKNPQAGGCPHCWWTWVPTPASHLSPWSPAHGPHLLLGGGRPWPCSSGHSDWCHIPGILSDYLTNLKTFLTGMFRKRKITRLGGNML